MKSFKADVSSVSPSSERMTNARNFSMKNNVTENKGSLEFPFKGIGETLGYLAPYQLSIEWFKSQVRVKF